MKARKRTATGKVIIDGHELEWSLLREAKFTTNDGYKGMAFSVQTQGHKTFRELILEFPFPMNKAGWAQREKERIQPHLIEAAIKQAMEAGWDPVSRGRFFAFQVPENPA